jgi:agmatine/peptidylarginine deiminase
MDDWLNEWVKARLSEWDSVRKIEWNETSEWENEGINGQIDKLRTYVEENWMKLVAEQNQKAKDSVYDIWPYLDPHSSSCITTMTAVRGLPDILR